MATAADSTAYGGGAGGKLRKRPFRRPQTTPYDRPLTALRSTWRNNDNSSNGGGGGGGGWLSRIVDPASKLISTGAHKFFSSVFRKRLLPPPPLPSSDENVGPLENHLGDAITEDPSQIRERDGNEGNIQNNGSGMDGVAELEQLLKQKTFTRSEIDRLTVLLHSRTVDKTGIAGQERLESTPSEPPAGHSREEKLDGIACENGVKPSEVPGTEFTPAGRLKVNDDDVASPAELAKAYMGSRSTRMSPSMLGPRSQAVREENHAFTTFQLHRPSISTVQKPLGTTVTSQNDFVAPRSRGRSAIYSMAPTPFSWVPSTATKGSGTSSDVFDGRSVLSSHKALKRRCSVLANDIGAVGPIRRIRQKSNLLYSKNLALSSSRTPLTNITPSEVGEASLYSSSKSQEDRGDMSIPVSSLQISSKSMEMGQRILQQLEKMTPPKEKSSEKKPGFSAGMSTMELTPATLHGQARKSLETVNSLKYLQSDQVGDKKVKSLEIALHELRDSAPKKQDKVYEISSNMTVNSSNKVYPENNEARITDNDAMGIAQDTAPVVLKSAVDAPKKSRAFQMSAYEDYLDLDDDVHSNGVASSLVSEGKRKFEPSSIQSNGNMLLENQVKTTKADTPPAFPALKSSSNLVLKSTAVESSTSAKKGISRSFPTDSVLNKGTGSSVPSLQPVTTSASDKADIPASTISFGLKSSDKVSSASFFSSSAVYSLNPKDVKSQCPSSVFAFASGATDAAFKSPESNNKSTEAVDLFKKSDNTSPSSFNGAFGQPTFTASTGNTGVSATKVGGDAPDTATATTASASGSSNSLTSSVAFPTIRPGLIFRDSPMASDSATMAAASGTDTAEKSKETVFGISTSCYLTGAASAATPSSTTAIFQFGVSTTSGTSSQLPSTIESMPSQSGGSALPASSGSSSLLKSGVNQFGPLTSVSSPSSSSSTFESSSSGSSSMAASGSASSASTKIFGSSSQLSNSPVFGSAFNTSSSSFGASSASTPFSSASSGFAFGTTSISAPANGSSAGVTFGATSSSSGFSFGASSATSSPGSVSPGFVFGSTSISVPPNGSTAGVAFGASPTSAAAGSSSSVFAFGPSSASSSTPLPPFSFGATSASSSAPSSTFSFGASPASSSAPSSTFSFEASSASSGAPTSTFSFGASPASATTTSASIFSFGSSAPAPASTALPTSQPAFGNGTSLFAFGSTPSPTPLGNNDQMTMEDSMAEDSIQSPAAPAPASVFGQSPTSNFGFGMAPAPAPAPALAPTPSGANPFQFGSQQSNGAAPQNPFQNSGSFDGGSFSLGAGGNDKLNRRFVKVRNRNRKK